MTTRSPIHLTLAAVALAFSISVSAQAKSCPNVLTGSYPVCKACGISTPTTGGGEQPGGSDGSPRPSVAKIFWLVAGTGFAASTTTVLLFVAMMALSAQRPGPSPNPTHQHERPVSSPNHMPMRVKGF